MRKRWGIHSGREKVDGGECRYLKITDLYGRIANKISESVEGKLVDRRVSRVNMLVRVPPKQVSCQRCRQIQPNSTMSSSRPHETRPASLKCTIPSMKLSTIVSVGEFSSLRDLRC